MLELDKIEKQFNAIKNSPFLSLQIKKINNKVFTILSFSDLYLSNFATFKNAPKIIAHKNVVKLHAFDNSVIESLACAGGKLLKKDYKFYSGKIIEDNSSLNKVIQAHGCLELNICQDCYSEDFCYEAQLEGEKIFAGTLKDTFNAVEEFIIENQNEEQLSRF